MRLFLDAELRNVLSLALSVQAPQLLFRRPRAAGSADALYPAAVPEREEGEVLTAVEGIRPDALDTVPNILSELVWTVAEVAYIALIVVEQEDDLAQLSAAGERVIPELPDATRNDKFLDIAPPEQSVADLLEAVRKAQHLRVSEETEVLRRPSLRERISVDSRPPEAEPAELLNTLV